MAHSQNDVKILPGWRAMDTEHILYPVNRKDNYHQQVIELEAVVNCIYRLVKLFGSKA